MKNIIAGMAYFIILALVVMGVLVIVNAVKKQMFPIAEEETQSVQETQKTRRATSEIQDSNTSGNRVIENNTVTADTTATQTTTAADAIASVSDVTYGTTLPATNDGTVYYDKDLGGDLELPVSGATGYASVNISLYSDGATRVIKTLKSGTAFVILQEDGDWWQVYDGDKTGWLRYSTCMINLPDVIPSIVYDNANAYKSLFKSSFMDIPGVTGEQLYSYSDRADGKVYNNRLQRYEYIVPVLYSMSKRVYQAQQNALKNGDTLVIYEGYRPYAVQMKIVDAVRSLSNSYGYVRAGVSTPPWNISWFIATSVSNHQMGYAIDTSLARVVGREDGITGKYKYTRVSGCQVYVMFTPIVEISMSAAVFKSPVNMNSYEAWKTATFSEGMKNNQYAQNLQKYCTDAGLTPIASEWWHFNDLHTYFSITKPSGGGYEIKDCLSEAPSD